MKTPNRISVLKKSPIILQKVVSNRSILNQRINLNTLSTINNAGESVKLIPLKNLPSSTSSQSPKKLLTNILPMQSTSKQIQPKSSVLVPSTVVKKSPSGTTITGQMKPATGGLGLPVRQNFKIIKLTKTATVLKHKECVAESIVMMLKSPEAYRAMLRPGKLCHIFKCMARECSYTTNSIEFFKKHYDEHVAISIKEKVKRPFGCQHCAYCGGIFDDWNTMEKHLFSRHAFCSFQCSYCFFRALTQSYVELHQVRENDFDI